MLSTFLGSLDTFYTHPKCVLWKFGPPWGNVEVVYCLKGWDLVEDRWVVASALLDRLILALWG